MGKTSQNGMSYTEFLSMMNYFLGFSDSKGYADRNTVFLELKSQGVISLSASKYSHLDLSDQLRAEWKQSILQDVAYAVKVQQEEKKLLEILDENNIPCVILKGSAAAAYYPLDLYRTFGDLDLLVKPEQYETTAGLLEASGYLRLTELYEDPRNATFRRGNVDIELHRRFFLKYHPEMNEFLYEGIGRRVRRKAYRIETWMLENDLNGLVLLEHVREHFLDGIGLRQIIDWLMFVNAVCTDEFWNTRLRPLAEQAELENFAMILTSACAQYFQVDQNITWYKSCKETYADTFIEYVFNSGNFGLKHASGKDDNDVFNLLSRPKTKWEWIKHIQNSGISHWSAAQKYKWLRPFAWVYQLGRYFVRSLKNGRIVTYLFKGKLNNARKTKALLLRLGIK